MTCAGSLLFTMDTFIPFWGSGKATFAHSVSPQLTCCICGEMRGRFPPSSYSVAWSGSVMLHGCWSTACQKRSFSACYALAAHLVDPANGGETVYDQICNHSAHSLAGMRPHNHAQLGEPYIRTSQSLPALSLMLCAAVCVAASFHDRRISNGTNALLRGSDLSRSSVVQFSVSVAKSGSAAQAVWLSIPAIPLIFM